MVKKLADLDPHFLHTDNFVKEVKKSKRSLLDSKFMPD